MTQTLDTFATKVPKCVTLHSTGSWKKALHATFPCMSFGRDSDNKNGSIVLVWQLSRYYYTMLWKRPQVQKQVMHCYVCAFFFISFDLILQLVQLLNRALLGKESCSTYTNSTLFWTLAHKQITHIFPLACQVVISTKFTSFFPSILDRHFLKWLQLCCFQALNKEE